MLKPTEAPKGQDAPERIWIQSDHIPDFVALDKWDQKPDPDENQLFTEYTRADLLATAQARAEQAEAEVERLREAATYLLRAVDHMIEDVLHRPIDIYLMVSEGAKIRSMADARAALSEGGKDTAARCAECDCKNGGTDCNWIKSDTAQKGDE
jgi:hypothetical protein